MKSILSELVRQERLTVVEEFKVDKPKTKSFLELVKNFNVEQNVLNIYILCRITGNWWSHLSTSQYIFTVCQYSVILRFIYDNKP